MNGGGRGGEGRGASERGKLQVMYPEEDTGQYTVGSCTGRASARGPGRPAAHGPGRARLL